MTKYKKCGILCVSTVKGVTMIIANIDSKVSRTISHYNLPDTEIVKTIVWCAIKRWYGYANNLKGFYISPDQIRFIHSLNNHK